MINRKEYSRKYYLKNKEKILHRHLKNKEERNQRKRQLRKLFPWKYTLVDIKKRCESKNNTAYERYGGRGIKCLISQEEIKKLWFRDKACDMERPSIDRKDNNGNYEYGNCRFIELSVNSGKDKKKRIIQLTAHNKVVKIWDSITQASNELNTSVSNIHGVLKGRQKTALGFKWRYHD